jgi:type II secretory pathway pseudopilin PulG
VEQARRYNGPSFENLPFDLEHSDPVVSPTASQLHQEQFFLTARIKGFSIIELLVEDTIIENPAAIARINFLQAQTRAKVCRTRTDMRTIATALESNALDHTKYPFDNR